MSRPQNGGSCAGLSRVRVIVNGVLYGYVGACQLRSLFYVAVQPDYGVSLRRMVYEVRRSWSSLSSQHALRSPPARMFDRRSTIWDSSPSTTSAYFRVLVQAQLLVWVLSIDQMIYLACAQMGVSVVASSKGQHGIRALQLALRGTGC